MVKLALRATLDVDVLISLSYSNEVKAAAKKQERLLENMRRIGRFRPDWAQKIQYFLEEQGWKLN